MKTVLIIDDSSYMRALIKIALSGEGYQIVGEAEDGNTGLALARKLQPDVITLDNILPDMFGIEILQTLVKEGQNSKIIMISAVGQDRIIEKVKKMGAADYLVKPFETETLIQVTNKAVQVLQSA